MATIAIHQPQYLPWLPYFQKMAAADCFVFLDNVQYQKRGLQNRNQIKGPNGPVWLTVPVNATRDDQISTVRIADQGFGRKHAKSVKQAYTKAAHNELFDHIVQPVLHRQHELLAALNIELITALMDFLGIKTEVILASSLDVKGSKEALIIDICRTLKATRYLSGKGAKSYQEETNFKQFGIELAYHASVVPVHDQCYMKNGFVPGMSILDQILNLGSGARALL